MPDPTPLLPEDPFPHEPSFAHRGVDRDGQVVVHTMNADEVAAFVATARSHSNPAQEAPDA